MTSLATLHSMIMKNAAKRKSRQEESDEKNTSGKHRHALINLTRRITLASEEEESSDDETASTSGEDSDEDTDWEETLEPPSARRRRAINDRSLRQCLESGMYQIFRHTRPVPGNRPRHNSALEYLQRLWTIELCELIAEQTNLYILQRQAKGYVSRRAPTTPLRSGRFLG